MNGSHLMLVLVLIVFGAVNTIVLTLQNHQTIPDLPENSKFTALLYLGQALCFVPYVFYKIFSSKSVQKQQSQSGKKKCPVHLPFIPGILDLLSSLLAYVSLGLISGSVWQISRGGVIITTPIFLRIFMKKKFTKTTVLGCSLAFLGITIVQVFQILLTQVADHHHNHTTTEQIVGVVLLLTSLIFNTLNLITQKIIFDRYRIHPFKMVYLEGIYGFLGAALVILVLNFVECPDIQGFKKKCVSYEGKLYMENIFVFYQQVTKNLQLLFYSVIFLISVSISVPVAVTISKVINPISRSLANVCRTILVWLFCLIITILLGKNDSQYKLQQTELLLNGLKISGFIIIVLGTLIYHDVIKVFKQKPYTQNQAQQNSQSLLTNQKSCQNLGNSRSSNSSASTVQSLQRSRRKQSKSKKLRQKYKRSPIKNIRESQV